MLTAEEKYCHGHGVPDTNYALVKKLVPGRPEHHLSNAVKNNCQKISRGFEDPLTSQMNLFIYYNDRIFTHMFQQISVLPYFPYALNCIMNNKNLR